MKKRSGFELTSLFVYNLLFFLILIEIASAQAVSCLDGTLSSKVCMSYTGGLTFDAIISWDSNGQLGRPNYVRILNNSNGELVDKSETICSSGSKSFKTTLPIEYSYTYQIMIAVCMSGPAKDIPVCTGCGGDSTRMTGGPFTIFGCYNKSDDNVGLGPLVAVNFGKYIPDTGGIQTDPDESSAACSCVAGAWDTNGHCCGDDTIDCGNIVNGALCRIDSNTGVFNWLSSSTFNGDIRYVPCSNLEYLSDGTTWIRCDQTFDGNLIRKTVDTSDYLCTGNGTESIVECCGDGPCKSVVSGKRIFTGQSVNLTQSSTSSSTSSGITGAVVYSGLKSITGLQAGGSGDTGGAGDITPPSFCGDQICDLGECTSCLQDCTACDCGNCPVSAADDSVFISQNVPNVMISDCNHTGSLTFRNIGTNSWIKPDYQLRRQRPADKTYFSNLTFVNLTQTVSPNTEQTFTFQVKPKYFPQDTNANFQWQMNKKGLGVFGERSNIFVVTIKPSFGASGSICNFICGGPSGTFGIGRYDRCGNCIHTGSCQYGQTRCTNGILENCAQNCYWQSTGTACSITCGDSRCDINEEQLCPTDCLQSTQQPIITSTQIQQVQTQVIQTITQKYYCNSDRKFINDLDVPNAQDACEKAGFKWTGTKCCGEPEDKPEFYNEPNGQKACWDSSLIISTDFVENTNESVLNYGGEFHGCDIGKTNFNPENNYLLHILDSHAGTSLITDHDYCDNDPQNNYYCSYTEKWIITNGLDKTHLSLAPISNPVQNAECCAKEECWNGEACIENQKNNPAAQPLNGVRCIDGEWTTQELKITPDGTATGYCPNETQCLVSTTSCIDSGQYSSDHFCENGQWSTRTKLLAKELMKLKGTDFKLFCDNKENTLNNLNYMIQPIGSVSNIIANIQTNNFCVLETSNDIIIGTTINKDLEDAQANILKVVGITTNCNSNALLDDGQFHACDATNKLWFNKRLKSLIYSPNGITIGQISVFSIEEIIRTVIDTIRNLIATPTEPSPIDTYMNSIKKFDRLYLTQQGTKKISASIEGKDPNTKNLVVEYAGFSDDVCKFINQYAEAKISSGSIMLCKKTNNNYYIFVQGNKFTFNPDLVWTDLTAKIRLK